MTPLELRDLLIRTIVRTHDGSATRWRKVVGQVRVYSRATHAHCNWEVMPTGSARDVALVELMVDRIRPQHPYVDEN